MQRIPVESSDIVSIGYDPKARTLEIEFKEGRVYQYLEVEPDTHRLLMKADSYGQYFSASISGRYRYVRLNDAAQSAPKHQAVAFVTANSRKLRDLQRACEPAGIAVEQLELPVDEIQSHDPETIAVAKAKHAYKLARRPVVANDVFWNILALRGFPGAYMSYVAEWFKAEDFLRLMEGKSERTINCTDTLVYYDGKRTKVFTDHLWGKIVLTPQGSTGQSIERVVILSGETETIAAVEEHEGRSCIDPDNNIWQAFAKWYRLQQRLGKV